MKAFCLSVSRQTHDDGSSLFGFAVRRRKSKYFVYNFSNEPCIDRVCRFFLFLLRLLLLFFIYFCSSFCLCQSSVVWGPHCIHTEIPIWIIQFYRATNSKYAICILSRIVSYCRRPNFYPLSLLRRRRLHSSAVGSSLGFVPLVVSCVDFCFASSVCVFRHSSLIESIKCGWNGNENERKSLISQQTATSEVAQTHVDQPNEMRRRRKTKQTKNHKKPCNSLTLHKDDFGSMYLAVFGTSI